MERRKFLANIICIGVGASVTPKVLGAFKSLEPPVDPKIFEYPLTYKESYKPSHDFIIGFVTVLKENEVTIIPCNKLEEFPVIRKKEVFLVFSNSFSEESKTPPPSHKEENPGHSIIVVNEDIPRAGAGNGITFLIDKASLSRTKLRLWDSVLFPIKQK